MDEDHRRSAEQARASIQHGGDDPSMFRAALLSLPPNGRDGWLDLVLGLTDLPDDGPELPRGCVPYLPCSVDVLLRMIAQAAVDASDVFVDIGSGVGRASALVHLLTGASTIGIEVQTALVGAARELASRLHLARVKYIEGDAAKLAADVTMGSVFFFYCPFGGERLVRVFEHLEPIARTRMLRICCVNVSLPSREWLALDPGLCGDLAIYRTRSHMPLSGKATPSAPAK